MGCRFPGGGGRPRGVLAAARGTASTRSREVPARPLGLGRYYDPTPTRRARCTRAAGGFLERVDGFDAAFFGISPREAVSMDPQQRLLLEVAWEALEDAGQAPDRLARQPHRRLRRDLRQRLRAAPDQSAMPERIDAYLGTGRRSSVAAGRLSYLLGLQGPSLAVDTACSSSLVAVHLACQSLRSRRVPTWRWPAGQRHPARPKCTIGVLQGAHARARRPLQDLRRRRRRLRARRGLRGGRAQAALATRWPDGDRILAVIRGTAVNQDGRSSGLTAPNGPAQEAVIRAALADGGWSRRDVELRRGPRHRHLARRPDRGAGAWRRSWPRGRARTGRCCSARSRPTSATSRRPRAWRA